jgi:hypothetical protein
MAESKAERGRNPTPLTLRVFSLDDLGGKMAQPPPPSASFGDLGQGFQVAHNNGSIHTVYNVLPGTNRFPFRLQKFSECGRRQANKPVSQEQPATRPTPKPYAIIPFSRNPDFVNRGDIINQVHQLRAEPPRRVALVGLGGVGYVTSQAFQQGV